MCLLYCSTVLFTRSLVILLQLITNTVDGLRQKNLCRQGRNKSVVFWGRRRSIRQKSAIRVFRRVLPSSRHITGNRMFFTEALPRNPGTPRLKRCMHRAAMAFLWKMTGWRRARWQRLKKKASVLVRTANLPSTITKAQKMLFPCVRTFR